MFCWKFSKLTTIDLTTQLQMSLNYVWLLDFSELLLFFWLRSPPFSNVTVPQETPTSSGSSVTKDSVSRRENIVNENVVGSSTDAPGPSWAVSGGDLPMEGRGVGDSSAKEGDPSSSQVKPDLTAEEEDSSSGSQNDIRRRRIQRFSSEPNGIKAQE